MTSYNVETSEHLLETRYTHCKGIVHACVQRELFNLGMPMITGWLGQYMYIAHTYPARSEGSKTRHCCVREGGDVVVPHSK